MQRKKNRMRLRFIDNCRKSEKQKGPLTTKEFEAAKKFWITQVQTSQPLKSDVGLKKDVGGIFRCAGRVQHYNPVFLPRNCKLAALIVRHVHEQTLHGERNTNHPILDRKDGKEIFQ